MEIFSEEVLKEVEKTYMDHLAGKRQAALLEVVDLESETRYEVYYTFTRDLHAIFVSHQSNFF